MFGQNTRSWRRRGRRRGLDAGGSSSRFQIKKLCDSVIRQSLIMDSKCKEDLLVEWRVVVVRFWLWRVSGEKREGERGAYV